MRGHCELRVDESVSASEAAPALPVARPFLIANLLASVGFGLIAMTICLPSMHEWPTLFGASQAQVQLSFSSFVIGLGAGQVFYGPLSDRYGRRKFLLGGFAIAGLSSLAAAGAPGLFEITVARFLQGVGAAAGMVIGRAMVQDYFTGPDRPRIMAYIGMVMGLCPASAMILGGQIHIHWGWRANFLVIAVIAAALVVMTWIAMPVEEKKQPSRSHWVTEMFASYAHLARLPVFLGYAIILASCTGTFYVFLSGAPTVLARYGVGPGMVGFYIMFIPMSYIAGNFLTTRLVKRWSENRLMLAGNCAAIAGIASVLILALSDVQSPLAVTAPLVLLGIGHGLLMPSALAGTVSLVPAMAGAAAGAAGLGQHVVGAFAGYAVGLVEHDSALNIALLMLVFMLLSLFSQLFLLRSLRTVIKPALALRS
jgi:MFS transporter, DHA1 family, multidrug resistance protein